MIKKLIINFTYKFFKVCAWHYQKNSVNNAAKIMSSFLLGTVLSVAFVSPNSCAAEPAVDFSITTMAGDNFTLSNFKQKKPVYLFFWATWCPICKKEIPRVKALHEKFGNQIEVLAINVGMNDSLDNIIAYQSTYQINYPIAFDENSAIANKYNVFGTPTQVVIDIDGNLRYQGHSYPVGLESFIKQLSIPTLTD